MKEIKTYRDLMRAFIDGHTVDVDCGEGWETIKTYQFDVTVLDDELLCEYRIKPTKPSIMKELLTFRDLLKAQIEGKAVQYWTYSEGGKWVDWQETMQIHINSLDNIADSKKHRIKPTKPSIDWNHVSDEFNYLARDEDGLFYLYGNKPKINNSLWCSVDHNVISASAFKSLEIGNCDWTESLVERPKE